MNYYAFLQSIAVFNSCLSVICDSVMDMKMTDQDTSLDQPLI